MLKSGRKMNSRGIGLGILKGMRVTMKNLLRRPVTVQYPEQRLNVSRRIRGNELVWNEKKCTGCATCAKTCPQGVIRIKTRVEGDKYVVEEFAMDTGYCIFCGLCVEACPYRALQMGCAYERAKYGRHELLQDKEMLKETPERQPSGYMFPEVAECLPRQTLLVERINED